MTTLAQPASALMTGALATYRLTRLMTTDTLTEPVRDLIWERFPPEKSKLGYVFTCEHCSSVYAAGAVTVLAAMTMPQAPRSARLVGNTLLAVLAMSGAVSLYHEHRERA